jgi:hypothetical protein
MTTLCFLPSIKRSTLALPVRLAFLPDRLPS